MKDIDFFMEPVRIRLTRKQLFDKSKKETKMFKGSIHGGFFTIIIVIILAIFFKNRHNEMNKGSLDISKKSAILNDFTDPNFSAIAMNDFSFLPSIEIQMNEANPTAEIKEFMNNSEENVLKINLEKLS